MSYQSFSTNASWSRAASYSTLPTPPASAPRRGAYSGRGRQPARGGTADSYGGTRFPAIHPDTPEDIASELRMELQQLRSLKGTREGQTPAMLTNTWGSARAGLSPGLSRPSGLGASGASAETRALEAMQRAASTHAMDSTLMREAVGTLKSIATQRALAIQAMAEQQVALSRLPPIDGIGRVGDLNEDRPAWAFGMDDEEFDEEWVARELDLQQQEEQRLHVEAMRHEIQEATALLWKQLAVKQRLEEQREMDVLCGQAEVLIKAVRFRHIPPKRRTPVAKEVSQSAMDSLEERVAGGMREEAQQGGGEQQAQVRQQDPQQAQDQRQVQPQGQQEMQEPDEQAQMQAEQQQTQQQEQAEQQKQAQAQTQKEEQQVQMQAEQRQQQEAQQQAAQAEEARQKIEEAQRLAAQAMVAVAQVLDAEQEAQLAAAVQQHMQQLQGAGQLPPELQQIQTEMNQVEAQAAQLSAEQQPEAMAYYQQLQQQYQATGLQWQEHLAGQMKEQMFPLIMPPAPPPAAAPAAAPSTAVKARGGTAAPPTPRAARHVAKPATPRGATSARAPAKGATGKVAVSAPSPRKVSASGLSPRKKGPAPVLEELSWTKAAEESAASAPIDPRVAPPPTTVPPAADLRCAQLDAFVARFGGAYSTGQSWHRMLCDACQHLAVGVLCVLMNEPGLPVSWVNDHFTRLTGWSQEDAVGKNCRFLQGKTTERPAVRMMVKRIREAELMKPIMLTNYRRDGSEFPNVLSLHPVHDSSGKYQYSVGLMHHAEGLETEEGELAAELRDALPATFDAALHVDVVKPEATLDEAAEQAKQWLEPMSAFTRRLLTLDFGSALDYVVETSLSMDEAVGIQLLHAFITAGGDASDSQLLDTVVAHARFERMGKGRSKVAVREAAKFYAAVYGEQFLDASVLAKKLKKQADLARVSLADSVLPDFVKSDDYCRPLLRQMLGEASGSVQVDRALWAAHARLLLWADYKMPPDVAGFLLSFAAVVEAFPACIVVSDMCLPGNPMVFVNHEFCTITGYSKEEATGLNCRFLQGPKTEPAAVGAIQDTMRRGVDCFVRITNYRKNGECFENLLSLRPVHDSNGVYRFCIGVQFDATVSPQNRMARLTQLLPLLPNEILVPGPPVGARHVKEFRAGENTDAADDDAIADALQSALAKRGAQASVQKSKAEGANAEYANNFAEMKRTLVDRSRKAV